MVTDFVCTYAKMLVRYPDDVEVTQKQLDENFYEIVIVANDKDVGKLIGKNGNMINAIKTILNGCKAKDGNAYKMQVTAK